MKWYQFLPHLNALLNTMSSFLLALGYAAIRRKDQRTHARFMLSAFASSSIFLVSYLTYHAMAGSKHYPGQGWLRAAYLAILASHTVLAGVTLPLVLITLTFALRKSFHRHRKIARWTFPIWAYVSVTGVVVYLLLYIF